MEEIYWTVVEGDLAEVRRLIQNNPSLIHAKDEHGRTLLHYAAIEGQIEIAHLLLSHGAEINARDNWGRTPLFVSIYEEPLVLDHTPIAKFLVSAGADTNVKDNRGDTPLHMAAFGETEIAAILLQNGADINARDNDGDTPLHKAVVYPEVKTVRLLLSQAGIESNLQNGKGLTPGDIALEKGWRELVELLRDLDAS